MSDHTPTVPSLQPETKLIPLTRGGFAIVDATDYEWLMQWAWRRDTGYAVRKETVNGKQKKIYMHRVLAGAIEGQVTDHVNGDRLDNRRSNLRACAQGENMRNRGPQANNTSGYKGVYWHKKANRWEAKIGFGGKMIGLGLFDTTEHAARAYDDAARELHGEFARCNFADDFKELEDYWPAVPDMQGGIDRFAQHPVSGEPDKLIDDKRATC